MNRLVFVFFLFLSSHLFLFSQQRLKLVEWNVENLFDTCHDVGKNDFDFTPNGTYHWTAEKYYHKVSMIARTLANIGGLTPPAFVALCEVENDSVLTRLTQKSILARLNYKYVMTHSDDLRGIDVALLYQPGDFLPICTKSFKIPRPSSHLLPTRDILYVSGLLSSLDTLDLFVCHFPSKAGGNPKTESFRRSVATILKMSMDSILTIRPHANIVVTGDFNSDDNEPCIKKLVGKSSCSQSSFDENGLVILNQKLGKSKICGNYFFAGRWSQLDHFIVSRQLLKEEARVRVVSESYHIVKFPWLLETRGKNEVPYRTHLGKFYHGGLSDHLPLEVDFVVK